VCGNCRKCRQKIFGSTSSGKLLEVKKGGFIMKPLDIMMKARHGSRDQALKDIEGYFGRETAKTYLVVSLSLNKAEAERIAFLVATRKCDEAVEIAFRALMRRGGKERSTAAKLLVTAVPEERHAVVAAAAGRFQRAAARSASAEREIMI
jgi:hypothetical protein